MYWKFIFFNLQLISFLGLQRDNAGVWNFGAFSHSLIQTSSFSNKLCNKIHISVEASDFPPRMTFHLKFLSLASLICSVLHTQVPFDHLEVLIDALCLIKVSSPKFRAILAQIEPCFFGKELKLCSYDLSSIAFAALLLIILSYWYGCICSY